MHLIMYLVVDIGNTNQKAALFNEAGEITQWIQKPLLSPSDLYALLNTCQVRACIISSVAHPEETLYSWLSQQFPTFILSPELALPIQLRYTTPSTLGPDRIANAVGSNHLFPNQNVLSIQAGSCVVTDFVTETGEYLGGSISPGMQMRFKALEHFTAKLPLLEYQPIHFITGDSTQNAILSGVINGLACEIDGLIDQYRARYANLKIILTGGDAPRLEHKLKNSIFAAQNLVLLGLYKILRLHAPE